MFVFQEGKAIILLIRSHFLLIWMLSTMKQNISPIINVFSLSTLSCFYWRISGLKETDDFLLSLPYCKILYRGWLTVIDLWAVYHRNFVIWSRMECQIFLINTQAASLTQYTVCFQRTLQTSHSFFICLIGQLHEKVSQCFSDGLWRTQEVRRGCELSCC